MLFDCVSVRAHATESRNVWVSLFHRFVFASQIHNFFTAKIIACIGNTSIPFTMRLHDKSHGIEYIHFYCCNIMLEFIFAFSSLSNVRHQLSPSNPFVCLCRKCVRFFHFILGFDLCVCDCIARSTTMVSVCVW